MQKLDDFVEQKKNEEVAKNSTSKNGRWWRWPTIGCGGFLALLFVLLIIGSRISQNTAEEIVALGEIDKEAQLEKLAEANDSVLNALDDLAPELATKERQRREKEQKVAVANAKQEKAEGEEAEYRKILSREIESMRKKPIMEDAKESELDQTFVTVNAAVLAVRAQWLADAPQEISADTKKLEQEYIRLHRAYQLDAFPRLRKLQVKLWRNKLWENDVEARTEGAGADRVVFTAGMFVANRNKQSAHEAALKVLNLLRFKRDTYEWYRGSESSYWDLETLDDNVMATMDSNNNWEAISLPEG